MMKTFNMKSEHLVAQVLFPKQSLKLTNHNINGGQVTNILGINHA